MNRRVPYIAQAGKDDCGAASLAMVMAYHGRHLTLDEVHQACRAARDSTSALAMIKVARANGFRAEGVRIDAGALGTLPLPAILHWKAEHFVVLESLNDEGINVVDPADGPRFVSREHLPAFFTTGVALIFEPDRAE